MSRSLNSAVVAACAADHVAPAYLVEMVFDSAPLRMWTGTAPIEWDGKEFTGVGHFGGVTPIEETRKISANGVELSLSGIPSTMVALALSEPYRNRRVRLWLALFDLETTEMLGAPVPVFAGRMDTMRMKDSGDTSTIEISCESKLIDLERARQRRYTHEDQREIHADDMGLEYVAGLQESEIFWGRVQK